MVRQETRGLCAKFIDADVTLHWVCKALFLNIKLDQRYDKNHVTLLQSANSTYVLPLCHVFAASPTWQNNLFAFAVR